MPTTITTTVYTYEELPTDKARENALDEIRCLDWMFDDYDWAANHVAATLSPDSSSEVWWNDVAIGFDDGTSLTPDFDYFSPDDDDLRIELVVNTFCTFRWESAPRHYGSDMTMGMVVPVPTDEDIDDALPDDYHWLSQDPDVARGRRFHDEMAEQSRTYAMMLGWADRLTDMVQSRWVASREWVESDEYMIDFLMANEYQFTSAGVLA